VIPTDAYAQPRRGPFRPDALGAWLAAHPTDAITPPSEVERPDPIEIDTASTERDFTRALAYRPVAAVAHWRTREAGRG
jgi:hypothetical protein